jgi:hypothetical protein
MIAITTLKEFLERREVLFEKMLDLKNEPEEIAKLIAEFKEIKVGDPYPCNECHGQWQSTMGTELSYCWCFARTLSNLANELVEMRRDTAAVSARLDEIGRDYGPVMARFVSKLFDDWRPPFCMICLSEERRLDSDPLEWYCTGGGWTDYMHTSCMEKFHWWADETDAELKAKYAKLGTKPPAARPVPDLETIDAAWLKKYGTPWEANAPAVVALRKAAEASAWAPAPAKTDPDDLPF